MCNAILYSSSRCELHSTCNIVLYEVQYFIALHCTVVGIFVQHCIALRIFVQHCIVVIGAKIAAVPLLLLPTVGQ